MYMKLILVAVVPPANSTLGATATCLKNKAKHESTSPIHVLVQPVIV